MLLDMLDKERTYALARELGIAAPQTFTVRTQDDSRSRSSIGFPCALKPLHSHEFARHFAG